MFDADKVSRLNIPKWEAVFRAEIDPGVVAIIAIHDISRGWGLGGCRMAHYDHESEALTDVLRLSRGMTFKNAIADLPLGGGKSVIIAEPSISGEKRQRVLENFGRFLTWINRDRDIYCSAEDMNTTVADMHVVKRFTKHIHGLDVDPSPFTAWGVFHAIKFTVDYFALDFFNGERSLQGKTVLVQGLGKVGQALLEHLDSAGARILITDVREDVIRRAQATHPGIEYIPPETILDHQVDVFAPCAKGEVVNSRNIDKIKFKILCGAANNQLANSQTGLDMHKRGVVYCPDYVANMGGVCAIQYHEIDQLSHQEALDKIEKTVRKMLGLTYRAAFRNNLAFNEAVDHVVKKLVWGGMETHGEFFNDKLFPLTAHSEPNEA